LLLLLLVLLLLLLLLRRRREAEEFLRAVLYEHEGRDDSQHAQNARRPPSVKRISGCHRHLLKFGRVFRVAAHDRELVSRPPALFYFVWSHFRTPTTLPTLEAEGDADEVAR